VSSPEEEEGLLGAPERKRITTETKRRWEDIIKIDLREIPCEDVGWI
jgi:hypothetical protein